MVPLPYPQRIRTAKNSIMKSCFYQIHHKIQQKALYVEITEMKVKQKVGHILKAFSQIKISILPMT